MNFSLVLLLFILLTSCGYNSDVGLVSETPAVSTIESPSNGTYGETENISITINFNRIVVVSGTPCLTITLDSGVVCASYASGSDSKELTFSYTVRPGDQDSDGIRIGAIDLNGGSIIDKRSRDASLDFTSGDTSQILVSTPGLGPNIQSVRLEHSGLRTGKKIDFIVEYDQDVIVGFGPPPSLEITLESGTVYAEYDTFSGTRIAFSYMIQSGDFDTDGLTLGTSILLNGSTITDLSGLVNADRTLDPGDINISGITVDGLDPVLESIDTPTNGYYKLGQVLEFKLNFSENVIVGSSVRIPLTIGSSTDYATYVSGSGNNQIVFSYTVTGAREDHNGIEIGAIDLNLGSIRDIFGDSAVLTHSTSTPNIKVDTIAPTISSLVAGAGTFRAGEKIPFHAVFSEAVIADPSYYISFGVGALSRQASYTSGNSTSSLVFEFTVPDDDYDSDGISINLNYSDPDMGSITDLAGNPLTSTTWPGDSVRSGTLVDARASVSSVSLPENGDYKTNSQLDFTVNYERSVVVTGTPRLTLDVGGNTYYANYLSGSGSTALVFRYTVAANDVDYDGITLAETIDLNGGDIKRNGARLRLDIGSSSTERILVDGITPAILTIETRDSNYKLGESFDFTVSFDHEVRISGTPRLPLQIGSSTVYANYISSPVLRTMMFRYTVSSTDIDADGISIAAGSIDLNGGTIQDNFLDNANIQISAQSFNLLKVDGIVPSISSITPPDNGTYNLNQDLNFFLQYNEPVRVSGVPRLEINIGSDTVYANYVDGTETNTLKFKYTIPAGKVDTNGISISTSVDLNGGSIIDLFLNNQSPLTFTAPTLTGVLVNSLVPSITGVEGPLAGTFLYNQTLNFAVHFSDAVTVTGTPKLDLDIGGNTTLQATYSSGSGTNTLYFSYQITTAGLSETEGVAAVSLRQFSGSTIKNASGFDADLTMLTEIFTGVLVDTTGPLLLPVTKPANGVYKNGGTNPTISFLVPFSQAMTVTGTPRIPLTVGSTTQYANYSAGSGTTQLTFSYSPSTSSLDLDGITASTSIDLNSGTIKNSSNQAPLSLNLGTLDLSKVFVAIPEMSHWYDLSDTSTLTLSGPENAKVVTVIQDKIGNYHFTHSSPSGVSYNPTGFNGRGQGYVDCAAPESFSQGVNRTSPIGGIFVYRAPYRSSLSESVTQLMIGGTSSTEFRINFRTINSSYVVNEGEIQAGGALPYAAPFSSSLGWGIAGLPLNAYNFPETWTRNAYATMGWTWNAPTSFNYKLCQFDGEIAEVILFDSSHPSKELTNEIGTYIFNRYGLNLPP